MEYDLKERTAIFGEKVVDFSKNIRNTATTRPLVSQIVRSGTSIGANYMEANEASSKKDFRNEIHICKKEAQETKHWLRMIAKADDTMREERKELWKEAHELTLIFAKITRSCDEN